MVSLDDAATMAADLPDVTEGARYGNRTWFVNGKAFVWERPFSKADLKRFGEATPPVGPIVAIAVEDLREKEALLASNKKAFFTIAHFENYPALLIQLNNVTKKVLREALLDAWLVCAPPPVATAYLKQQNRRR
jgi:hypothetical protein